LADESSDMLHSANLPFTIKIQTTVAPKLPGQGNILNTSTENNLTDIQKNQEHDVTLNREDSNRSVQEEGSVRRQNETVNESPSIKRKRKVVITIGISS
jgi:hypothetical protein